MLEKSYQIKPSNIARVIFILFLTASCLVVVSADMTVYVKLFCFILLLLGAKAPYNQLVADLRLTLQVVKQRDWLILHDQQLPIEGKLAGDSIMTPYFILLRFHCHDKTRSYVILRDSLAQGAFKKLLLRLMAS